MQLVAYSHIEFHQIWGRFEGAVENFICVRKQTTLKIGILRQNSLKSLISKFNTPTELFIECVEKSIYVLLQTKPCCY